MLFNKIKLLFCAILCAVSLSSQTMWPGDANNNGIVNGADFIFYGLAYGSEGPTRPNATSNWTPQAIAPWSQNFANGINYAFADFDGDGKIDNSDQSKFESNWGRVHGTLQADGYGNSAPGAPAKVKLIPSATTVAPGANLSIDVRIGDAQHPVNNLYGVAFKFRYSQDLVNNGGSDIDFNELNGSWVDFDGNTRKFFQKDEAVGRAETGLTRTNQAAVSGQGSVGNFIVIIEDIIVGRLIDTFEITIDSLIIFDGNLAPRVVEGDTIQVQVVDPRYVATRQVSATDMITRIAPNPSNGDMLVTTAEPVEHWALYDMNGKTIPFSSEIMGTNRYHIKTFEILSGVYVLKGQTNGRVFQRLCIFAP